MRFPTILLTLSAIASLPVGVANASPARACASPSVVTSGVATTSIIELYTSEGCDSCPLADKWFSTLRADAKVIPLAFHVDYWDYIGWKDRFGKPAFAERQRAEVTLQGSRTVYTPQMLLNGKDWRSWSSGSGLASSVRDMAARSPRAALTLALTPAEPQQYGLQLSVKVPDAVERKESALFIAVTENNLVSRVSAGENRGVTLKHDHVVRELIGPIAIRVDGSLDITRNLALAPDWKQGDVNITAFVQNQRNGDILQAVSSPLCR